MPRCGVGLSSNSLYYHGCFAGNAQVRACNALTARTGMQACPHPFPFDARCLSFGCDVLKCACGGTRTLIAAVKKPAEIERFLRFLKLWPNADERGQVLPISCSKKLAIPVPTRARATGRV